MHPVIDSISFQGVRYDNADAAADAVARYLNEEIDKGMGRVVAAAVDTLHPVYRSIEREHGNPWPTGGPPWGTNRKTLSRRSGGGLRSIKESIDAGKVGDTVTGSITPGKMGIHQTGGIIVPRNGRYLTVPLMGALDSRGLPLRRRARSWDNTYVARSKRGNLIIFRRETGGKVTPLYLLATKVRIRPRLRMEKHFANQLPYFAEKAALAIERQFR